MKSMLKQFSVLLFTLLLSAGSSLANTLPGMPVGFYQVQSNQKIVYAFEEMISNDNEVELGLSIVGKEGYLVRTRIAPEDQITFAWKNGPAEISALSRDRFQMRLLKNNGELKETIVLQFLGADQIIAAKSLGLNAELPVTRYISHRGTAQIPVTRSHSMFGGNTIQAMNISLLSGYDGFELDVQMTADRKFAVSHDNNLSVSTDCKGKIDELPLAKVTGCEVKFTGFVPEKKWFHSKASIHSMLPSLEQVFNQFITDSRLKKIIIDVKPGNVQDQAEAFATLLKNISIEDQTKIIFLIRDVNLQKKLEAYGFMAPLYAIESESGWDPLEHPDKYFNHRPVEALSLSLGIGLGFAGMNMTNLANKLRGVWSAITSIADAIAHSDEIDVGLVRWSPRNQKRFLEVLERAQANRIQIVGWTINTPVKIEWLRDHAPKLQYVISDLPFRSIAKIQVDELESLLKP